VRTPTKACAGCGSFHYKISEDQQRKKQIKQNFPLRYFWGGSKNAIKTPVYCVLIAQLLMVVIRKKANPKKSFVNMRTIIRLHLMSYVDLLEFIKDSYKAWLKTYDTPNTFAT